MNLLKEPYKPLATTQWATNKNYSSLYKGYIRIHSGESSVKWYNILWPSVVAGVALSAGLANPIMFIVLMLIPLLWVIAPGSRLISQDKMSALVREGAPDYAYTTSRIPDVNWKLVNESPLYKDAVIDWLDAVRASGEFGINKTQWGTYLHKHERLVIDASKFEPDFQRVELLREIMDENNG